MIGARGRDFKGRRLLSVAIRVDSFVTKVDSLASCTVCFSALGDTGVLKNQMVTYELPCQDRERIPTAIP
jgi:hypothetical protein